MIKQLLISSILLVIIANVGRGQEDFTVYETDTAANFDDRLKAISILTQGGSSFYALDFGATSGKPACIFTYRELKKSYNLPEAKIHLRAETLAYMIASYALADSASNLIDSITVQFLPWKKNRPADYSWSFLPPFTSPNSTDEQRMQDLLSILPYFSEYEIRKDGVEVLLTEWPGITPEINREQYTNILAFVLFDYVFRRKQMPITISYHLADGQMIRTHPYYNMYNDMSLKQVIHQQPKKRELK